MTAGAAGPAAPDLVPTAVAATAQQPADAAAALPHAGPAMQWPQHLIPLHVPVATHSPECQRWFNQGLLLAIAFNHDEAVRSFRMAQAADPACAMALWGEAYALGPNINLPMTDPAVAARAHATSQEALARIGGAEPAHQVLIAAMAARYGDPQGDGFDLADRSALDEAYAAGMEEAWRAHGDDPLVGALYAEALLTLHPWETWTKEGKPLHRIEETQAVLERVAELDPNHPLGNHLYIHAIEAAPHKRNALPAARRLGRYAPAMGHLVHMPSHLFIQTGNYLEAERVNTAAIRADRAYFQGAGPQGIYEFYRAHNHHFRCYGAMFAGRRAVALAAAQELVDDLPAAFLEQMAGFVDGFLPVIQHVRLRFGMWAEVLKAPVHGEGFPIARAMDHYARGIAFAATGRVAEAAAEQAAFQGAREQVPEDAVIGVNPAHPVLAVAEKMLEGELRYRRGEYPQAFAALEEAVRREDGLRYDEPSPWMMPVRHALAALLLEQGHVDRAASVYEADLAKHPENGWSLFGLMQCAEKQGDRAAAAELGQRFRAAWAHADVDLLASCACANGVAAVGQVDMPAAGGPTRCGAACCGPGCSGDDATGPGGR